MPTLTIRFQSNLKEMQSPIWQYQGPIFHRWLPDGQQDAITLNTGNARATMTVWFERLGSVDHPGWMGDPAHRNIGPDVIATQAKSNAGPLFGQLEITDLSEEEVAQLQASNEEPSLCEPLVKGIVQDWFYPPLARFVDMLRTNFGQYWLSEVREWDARNENLAGYCLRFAMKWSLDSGVTWKDLRPGVPMGFEPTMNMVLNPERKHLEYLTHQDWRDLQTASDEGYTPSPAAHSLARSHRLVDQGHYRAAFIDGVVTLELAISEFVRGKLAGADKSLLDLALKPIESKSGSMNLQVQIALIGTLAGIPVSDIQSAVKSINIRNKIIHEGHDPKHNADIQQLSGLLRTIAALLPGLAFKFPRVEGSNLIAPVSTWEQSMSQNYSPANPDAQQSSE